MLETKTFKENPNRAFKKVALVFLGFILFFALLVSLDGFKDLFFLLIISGIFLFVFVLTVFVTGFKRFRSLICTQEKCIVNSTKFLQGDTHEADFLWSDVSDTNIVERFQDVGVEGGSISSYFFEVTVNAQVIQIWDLNFSSKKTTNKLLNYVNTVTPHLKYVWEEIEDFGDRQVIVQVDDFCKVARNN